MGFRGRMKRPLQEGCAVWWGSRCGPAHSTGRVALTRVYLGILRGYGDSSEGACHVLVAGEPRQHPAIRAAPGRSANPRWSCGS